MLQLPFLKTGQIFAESQSEGRTPEFSDCLKMISNIEAISAAQFFYLFIFIYCTSAEGLVLQPV